MKRINIQSLLQASRTLKESNFRSFLEYYDIKIRAGEIEDLSGLVEFLDASNCNAGAYDKFYVGYKIPQIGKEFDLLRFGKKSIVNIELKRSCSEDKIKKQLTRNKYYLGFIGREVYAFTYVSDSKELYFLDNDERLRVFKAECLVSLLATQVIDSSEFPDDFFDPSDYLVSPFNSTEKFLEGRYFLTHQQEETGKQIINTIDSSISAEFISVIGAAGTGKTLLVYDIARQVMNNGGKSLVIHCGQLNNGHQKLKNSGWSIVPIKSYKNNKFEDYDLIIVDEAQRIYLEQLDEIVLMARQAKCCCVFSHDKVQTLASWEESRGISAKIESINSIAQYKLSEKIRTNKEIAAFIKMLFSNKRTLPVLNKGNIEINYFSNLEGARKYLFSLDEDEWEVLRLTPSQYKKEFHEKYSEDFRKTSHQVMGQEFDNVAVAIDGFFKYDGNGNLVYVGETYYASAKMLFQNITRARKRLNIVIIGNEELLGRCISILK